MSDPRILGLRWPRQLRPGDERYINEAVVVDTGRARCRLRFLFGEGLCVHGAYSTDRNAFQLPKVRGKQAIAVKFAAAPHAQVNSRREIAVVLTVLRLVWWRLALGVVVVASAVVPVVAQALRASLLSIHIGLGDAVVLSLPAGLILAALLAWRRIMAASAILLWRETTQEQVVAMEGTAVGCIEIVQRGPDLGTAAWSADA